VIDPPVGDAGPAREDCQAEADVGKFYYDADQEIWYECIFDRSRAEYTWAIVPPVE